MANFKGAKRSLLMSALAIVLCVSMLVGSTFAWFTDTESANVNKIQSGTLEVDLMMFDGTDWVSAEGQTLNFIAKDGNQNILWEPGCTYELPALKVVNNGNLHLKYQIHITGITGDAKLLEVIDFTIANEGSLNGTLAPQAETAAITLTGHMDEQAGNDYQNLTLENISITVVATQMTAEFDSYGDQYDAAAGTAFVGGNGTAENPYLVDEGSQLLSISDYYDEYTYFKVADGVETLDLTGVGNIKLNGSFDGNGVEITGLTTALFEFVGKVDDPQEIKISNFTATVNTTDGRALVKNINNSGTTTFENVTLHGYIEGQYNMGSFYNYGTANNTVGSDGADYTVSFVNAKSDVTLVCTTGNAIGGMLGHGFEGANYKLSINMDENSGYTGKMYTTGTATCYEVIAMCSHSTYILNGVEVSRYDRTYPSTKLTVAAPTMENDGYYVTPVDGADHYVVSLNSQLTAYDENGVKIANKAGMTWVLGQKTITAGLDGKIFDLVESATIVNGEEHACGYELTNGALTIYSGRELNYASGWVTLYVNQYDADGNLLATGKISVYTFAEPNA